MDKDELKRSLDESVDEGLLGIVGWDQEEGERYRLTDAGERRVHTLLDEAIETAIDEFQEAVGVPHWMARDMILSRAAKTWGEAS